MMEKKWKIFLAVLLTFVVLGVLFIGSVYLGVFGHLQSRKELLSFKNATASKVLSSEGNLIGRFYSENRTNVTYRQIPPYLIDALIATEDVRFFEHKGVDSRSLARVLVKTILFSNRSSGGGSTITQQLAKNMFGRKRTGAMAVFINKVREIILAYRIEKTYNKEEILTLYLNTVPFGENIYGIETAAAQYFNKRVEELKIEEAAVLTGMLKATSFYHPVLHPDNAKNRRNIVLDQMEKYAFLQPAAADSLRMLPLITDYNNSASEGIADYFLVQVKNETKKILDEISAATGKNWDPEIDGLVITTTLNLALQTYANSSFHEHLPPMQKRLTEQYTTRSGRKLIEEITESRLKGQNLGKRADEINMRTIFDWNGSYSDSVSVRDSIKQSLTLLHAGLFAMDPQTGAVLAWVGGIDFSTQQYDQILARRQLGSVFKPILFAAAFEEGIEPCEYLNNDSVILSGFEDWTPENFDHTYGGKYSVAGALVKSMNVPSFSLYMKIGFYKLDSLWTKMGFTFPLVNHPSLALGTSEASIREIAIAYSAFANGGYKVTPQSIVTVTSAEGEVIYQNPFSEVRTRVLTARTGLLMSAILRKAVQEGTGASMRSIYGVTASLAGKTGTSQNYSDAWFAAFNPKMTIVARVGASSPAIHFYSGSYGTGGALALPLVALTLKGVGSDPIATKQLLSSFPKLPPELAAALDCPDFEKDTFLDNFLDLFKKKELIYNTDSVKATKKKKPFFKRLFKR